VINVFYAKSVRINILSPARLFERSGIHGEWDDNIRLYLKGSISPFTTASYTNNLWYLNTIPSARPIARVRNGIIPFEVNALITNEDVNNNTLWHRRMGHLNYADVKKLNDMAIGLNLTNKELVWEPNGICQECEQGKAIKRIPGPLQSHTDQPLRRLFSDYWGPYQSEGLEGKWYYILIIDEATSHEWLKPTDTRSDKVLVNWCDSLIG
jgi:hypothetical protein